VVAVRDTLAPAFIRRIHPGGRIMSLPNRSPLRVEHLEDRAVPAVLDLTTACASGVVNDALFQQFNGRTVSHHHLLDKFVELDGRGRQLQGYNTNARPLQFQEEWNRRDTHAIKVSDLPSVTVNGVKYREIVLDVTQPRNKSLVSLDELRLYVSNSATLRGYSAATGALAGLTPVYDLDAGGDNWVKLNARLYGHNARGDMTMYVADAALAGGKYLYLYSKFGVNESARGGEVSWSRGRCGAVGVPTPPPPSVPPPVAPGSISGIVYQDTNYNGEYDEGEELVANRTVWIDANDNQLLDEAETSTTTDENGAYSLTGLPANTEYLVRAMADDGFASYPIPVYVNPGEAVTGVNFGLNPPSNI
jgi:SdrD B-like domain